MNNTQIWYQSIIKPSWAPPSWLFGPVWAVLYILIIVSFGSVVGMYFKNQISALVVLPFILNIVFNLIYSPLQFVYRNYALATIDIFLVLGTLIWAIASIWTEARWVAYVNIPYLLWVTFATILQVTILVLNK